MNSQPKEYTLVRMLSIFSTATGYDIKSYRKSEAFNTWKKRTYKNVSASTMRRFYRLSRNDIDAQVNKHISFLQHCRIFPAAFTEKRKVDYYMYSRYDY